MTPCDRHFKVGVGDGGPFPFTRMSNPPPPPPPPPLLQDTAEQGFTLVFTDGSSEKFDGVGRLGGYGVFRQDGQSIAEHMPIGIKQTNNAAELMAALRDLRLHTHGKVAICSDSEYVLLGVHGVAKRCRGGGGYAIRIFPHFPHFFFAFFLAGPLV